MYIVKCLLLNILPRISGAASIYNSAHNTTNQDRQRVLDFEYVLSIIGFIWWLVIIIITYYGFVEIVLKFNSPKVKPSEVQIHNEEIVDEEILEGVTILRPVKGLDPELKSCLESSLLQRYPKHKFEVIFCVESPVDPAIPVIEELIQKYKDSNVEILIDAPTDSQYFGPNPKINNLAKGYKKAKFDIVWIIDSNVWLNPGTLLRSVLSLKKSLDNGRCTYDQITGRGKPVKIVHHVPLAISIDNNNTWGNLGARLDEMFLFTSHAKFYVFFNKASIAPCVNGKSNMYRRSDLDSAVLAISRGENHIINNKESIAADAKNYVQRSGESIRFFARYIGEDNMIGIAIWQTGGRTGMTGDVVVQPIGGANTNNIGDYANRRVRWLRVRKYMVLAATLFEPTTESLLIGIFGTFGISNLFFQGKHKCLIMGLHEVIWCMIDYFQFTILLKYANKDLLQRSSPPFFLQDRSLRDKLKLSKWLPVWLLREVLALPIWIKAMCGTQIDWRSRPFKIRPDLCAEEL